MQMRAISAKIDSHGRRPFRGKIFSFLPVNASPNLRKRDSLNTYQEDSMVGEVRRRIR
jgi:hypothetical protein